MWQLRLNRLRYTRRVAGTALHTLWQSPLPSPSADWREGSFLVCDAEMSSLEVADGELLSLGWVCVDQGSIALDSARHILINADQTVGQSATIHHLRDCELSDGVSSREALLELLAAAQGKWLVFHNATLDMAFLNRLTQQHFGAPLLVPIVDTLQLEHARLKRQDQPIKPGDLRLSACRARYNLPPYPAHNALLDALATAELLIAQAKHRAGKGDLPLRAFR